jgi:hypothetical protein
MEDLASVAEEAKNPPGTTRRVFVFEILGFAKKSCRLCIGVGVFSMTNDPKVATRETICGCAVRRFLKFHGTDVTATPSGDFFWLEGRDPRAEEIAVAKALAASATTPEAANVGTTVASGTGQ